MEIERFLESLWADYVQIAPQAARIHDIFRARGEHIVNDHVAFRTFGPSLVDIESLEPLILQLGYRRLAPYEFIDKGIRAWSYVPETAGHPRIFFSELAVETLSDTAQRTVATLLDQIDATVVRTPAVFWAGRLWRVPDWNTYRSLLTESEYAAWVSVMGLRPNHFTISVNHLHRTPEVSDVVALLKDNGFAVNDVGGEVKGTPQDLLQQAATLADRMMLEFADGDRHEVTTCYYEFARRYPDPNGKLYDGFVAASADKIFESTHTGIKR